MEVRLLAARRIGELVPAAPREETGRGRKLAEERRDIEIPHQRLSEFRKLAEIPEDKFKEDYCWGPPNG